MHRRTRRIMQTYTLPHAHHGVFDEYIYVCTSEHVPTTTEVSVGGKKGTGKKRGRVL